MTSIGRFGVSFALAGLSALWVVSPDGLAGAPRGGMHLTPTGYKVPVYGMSRTSDASGNVGTGCARLSSAQIDEARLSRSVSRSMLRAVPRIVVQAAVAGGVFEVIYSDTDGQGFRDARLGPARRQAFEAALNAWALVLDTVVPIVIQARMEKPEDAASTLLASAGPVDFAVRPDQLVPLALAEQKFRENLNGDSPDIEVVFSPDVEWDYATHGRAANGKVSFVYVTIHELGHGLGFVDSFDPETGELANGTPFTYDLFINRGTTADRPLVGRSADRVVGDLVSRDLFFNGPRANDASRRSIVPMPMIKLFAPDPYEKGSSVAHVDQVTYSDFKVGLMTPYDFGSGTDKIDVLTLGILEDLGYTLRPGAITARLPKQ